jgi:suppressor for copper-sensitivity B
LFGFFEISLPGWAQGLALIGAAGGTGPREYGLLGHFLTGAFATLLATPCSAPFLGTAVGFALARGPVEVYLTFTALGFGLALPYLAIAAVPALAMRLPRPGPWMITLRRILGLALVGTAVWLLSVLKAQVDLTAALGIGALIVALGLLLWFGKGAPTRRIATPALVTLLALAAISLPIGSATRDDAASVAVSDAGGKEQWRPLDPRRIHDLVSEGKVVFVDVTADWCITCRINKSLVIDRRRVSERLNYKDVITMRGDWTLPSEEISHYLESFGRYGIPFDAVYGPGTPEGLLLPELLTVDAVIEALEQAADGPPRFLRVRPEMN